MGLLVLVLTFQIYSDILSRFLSPVKEKMYTFLLFTGYGNGSRSAPCRSFYLAKTLHMSECVSHGLTYGVQLCFGVTGHPFSFYLIS